MNWITEIISPVFMEALGWTLLHSLWQGLVVMSALGLALAFIDSKNAQIRYLVSVSAACVMLIWTSFTMVDEYQHAAVSASETLSQPAFYSWSNIQIEIQEELSAKEKVISLFEALPTVMNPFIPWITFGWMLGVIVFTTRWLGGIVYLRHLRTHNIVPVAYLWQLKVNKLARKMGIGKTILLRESATITVPMVIGHLKPVVLIPMGILNGLTPQQLEAIFVHELAHIQRYDFIINLVLSQIEALFFYHPAFWWISAKIRDEREHCCDDIAVSMCKDPVSYARTLADLEAQKHQSVHLSMGLAGRKNHLLTRIQRIVMPDLNHTQSGPKVFFAALLVILMTSTAWVSPTSEPVQWPEQANQAPQVKQLFPGMVYQIEPPMEEFQMANSVIVPEINVEVPQIFSIEVPEWNFTFNDSPPPNIRYPLFPSREYERQESPDIFYFEGQFDSMRVGNFQFNNESFDEDLFDRTFQQYVDVHQDQWLNMSQNFPKEVSSQQYNELLTTYERAMALIARKKMEEERYDEEELNADKRKLMKLERVFNMLKNRELEGQARQENLQLRRQEMLAEKEARQAELFARRQVAERQLFMERAEAEARTGERRLREMERSQERVVEAERQLHEMEREMDKIQELAELESLKELRKLEGLAKLSELKKLEELAKLKELKKLEGLAELEKLQRLEKLGKLEELKKLEGLAALGQLSELSILGEQLSTDESRMQGFQATFAATLRVDGYISENTERLKVKVHRNMLKVNGKEISGNDFDRYMELMESYGFELSRGSEMYMDLD